MLAAAGGEEALALAATVPRLGLLVSDVVMPDLRGPDLHRRLLELHPGTPVLFVSGYADRDLVGVELDRRVGFLAKPFSPLELVRRVRAAIAAR